MSLSVFITLGHFTHLLNENRSTLVTTLDFIIIIFLNI